MRHSLLATGVGLEDGDVPEATPSWQFHALLIHVALMVTVPVMGILIGMTFPPGAWYESLAKPAFTPPGWLFGPVWAVLYVIVGWVGARKIVQGGALGLWSAQMTVNWLWSPAFFGMQWPIGGMIVILAMLGLILAFIAYEWRRDRVAALMFLPYAAWVTLAGAVNGGVILLN